MAIHYYSTHHHIEPEYEYEVARQQPIRRVSRIVWGVFYVILAFLLLRFGLKLIGANSATPFVDLIYTVSGLFILPFQYILPAARSGRSILEWTTLVAMFGYWFIAWILMRLVNISRPASYETDTHWERRQAF